MEETGQTPRREEEPVNSPGKNKFSLKQNLG